MDPPTGTVTLVFSDIQGSTKAWESLGDRFEEALQRHNALVREAIAAHGGYEAKTEGDSFMVAFASSRDALAFCLAVQRSLATAAWPAELGPRLLVRMGVHTGVPSCRPDPITCRMDYFGPVVNRAARVVDAAHGGQVLLSQAAFEEASGLEASVTDLGEHALRGLEQRVHLWQVLPTEQADRSFPRPRTVDLRRTNLRAALTSFVGREREVVDIGARLERDRRLLTLVGPGGSGKSRLASHYGARSLDDWPGGVWFVDLTEARTLSGVCSVIAGALDVPLLVEEPEEQLVKAIQARSRCLLIVDNAEHVVSEVRSLIARWLGAAPNAVFLVTSREALRIAGEELLEVPPLPLPTGPALEAIAASDAVALFVQRAREVAPRFELTEQNAVDIRRRGAPARWPAARHRAGGVPLQGAEPEGSQAASGGALATAPHRAQGPHGAAGHHRGCHRVVVGPALRGRAELSRAAVGLRRWVHAGGRRAGGGARRGPPGHAGRDRGPGGEVPRPLGARRGRGPFLSDIDDQGVRGSQAALAERGDGAPRPLLRPLRHPRAPAGGAPDGRRGPVACRPAGAREPARRGAAR